jgi:low temperature requirement protein LtrA
LARDVFTFCHYPIVAGIILFAVAAKKTVAHPDEALSGAGRFALGAGIALYLLGFVLARYRSIRRIAWERVGAGAAAALGAFLLADMAAAALMALVVAVLALALAVESARLREVRASVRTGH